MKKKDTHHFFLGLFVLAGSGVIGGSLTFLGADRLFLEHELMETYFDESVNGLEEGSPVKFRGITVGEVQLITTVGHFYQTRFSYALVRVRVDKKKLNLSADGSVSDTFEDRIRRGLRVSLARSSLTGGAYLETAYITDPSKSPELDIDWLPHEIYVPSAPSTLVQFQESLEKVLNNLARADIATVVDNAGKILERFDKSLAKLDLEALAKKAHTVMDGATATVKDVGKNLDGLTRSAETTLADIRQKIDSTVTTANAAIGKVDHALGEAKLAESLTQLAAIVGDAKRTIEQIQALTARTEHTVDGVGQLVRGRSREIQVAIGDLRELLGNLNTLTGNLNQYPSLLLFGKPPKSEKK